VASVDLYNNSYGNSAVDAYRKIRLETYGEDFGQTSWTTPEEIQHIADVLGLGRESHVVDIGCGSGGCALYFAKTIGCRVDGLDVNGAGIRSAIEAARAGGLDDRASFMPYDVSSGLPYISDKFGAIYSNDAFCHVADRGKLLGECWRVLRPGGRLLFSDALVITGAVSNEEIATRSSIGRYIFVPRGENERLLEDAGFKIVSVEDTSAQAAAIAGRWRDARARREAILLPIEGEQNFRGLQKFLACVHDLTNDKRLSRFLYLASRP
jgi:cyclopropane fatty-acyl-phospholipid synthase-like methyltransferase